MIVLMLVFVICQGIGVVSAQDVPAEPTPLDPLHSVIASASLHTCFVTRQQRVRCWGCNRRNNRALGYTAAVPCEVGSNNTTDIRGRGNVPLRNVPADVKVLSVGCGVDHSCALLDNGEVQCWGPLNVDATGVLGRNGSDPGDGSAAPLAAPVVLGARALQLSVGFQHNCVVLNSRQVKCWGVNRDREGEGGGRLGIAPQQRGTDEFGPDVFDSPADLPEIPLPGPARMVAAGLRHTCVLLVDGQVVCFGDNARNQLGLNSTTTANQTAGIDMQPVPLPSGNYSFIAAGALHNCVIESTSREVFCWGLGLDGRLGYGSESNVFGTALSQRAPVSLMAGAAAVRLSSANTCAMLVDGQVQCWGSNSTAPGVLGFPRPDGLQLQPGRVVALPDENAIAVGMGDRVGCAKINNGSLYCWGGELFGQNGYPTPT